MFKLKSIMLTAGLIITMAISLSACKTNEPEPLTTLSDSIETSTTQALSNPSETNTSKSTKTTTIAMEEKITMEECKQWLDENNSYMAWFPENWDEQEKQIFVVVLHGSGGSAEKMYNFYYEALTNNSKYNLAFISFSYARKNENAELIFDNGYKIYDNLSIVLDKITKHCPISEAATVYHGFSKGAARGFEIAALDKNNYFDAFVIDSGTTLAETAQQGPNEILENMEAQAYAGKHFWLYCGEQDKNTCKDMLYAKKLITSHGGIVDEIYKNTSGGHGIFSHANPEDRQKALENMFLYMESF